MNKESIYRRKQGGDAAIVPIRVSMHGPNGCPYEEEAEVVLVAGKARTALNRVKGASLYERSVLPGVYRLRVKARDLVAPERSVVVPETGKTASAYLGNRSWPEYRFGENVVPFKPCEDVIAVCFEVLAPAPPALRSARSTPRSAPAASRSFPPLRPTARPLPPAASAAMPHCSSSPPTAPLTPPLTPASSMLTRCRTGRTSSGSKRTGRCSRNGSRCCAKPRHP